MMLTLWVLVQYFQDQIGWCVKYWQFHLPRFALLLKWMVSKEAEAKAATGGQEKTTQRSSAPMISIINQSAQKNQITLKRFEPEGDAKLRVWVEEVPFNNFILWVQELETAHQVHVSSLSLDNPEQTGRISAKLILNR